MISRGSIRADGFGRAAIPAMSAREISFQQVNNKGATMIEVKFERKFNPEDVALAVASSNSDEQARFFNAFAIILRESCSEKGYSYQLAFVRPDITEDTAEVLAELLPEGVANA